jgi:antitoxin component YwqK of YwqJK toxin-antitoxin module
MTERWYVLRDGEEWEVTREQLQRLAAAKSFQAGDKVRKEGMREWIAPGRLSELLHPRGPRPVRPRQASGQRRKRGLVLAAVGIVAGLLAMIPITVVVLKKKPTPKPVIDPSPAIAAPAPTPPNYDENPVPASEMDFSKIDYAVLLSAPDYSKGPHGEPLLLQRNVADPIQFYQSAEYRSPVLEEGFLPVAVPKLFPAGIIALGTAPKGTGAMAVSGILTRFPFVLHGKRTVYYPMVRAHAIDKKELEEWWSNGKRHGTVIRYYLSGKKQSEGAYVQGLQAGLWTEWSEQGAKTGETPYFNGKSHGVIKGWHENGKLRLEGTARNGQWHGKRMFWYENGEPQEQGFWVSGRRQNWLKEWTKEGQLDLTKWDKGDVAYVPKQSSRRAFIWKLNVSAMGKGRNNELLYPDIGKFVSIFGTPQMLHTAIPRARDGTLDYGAAMDLYKPGIQEWIYTCTDAQMSLRVETGNVFAVLSIGEITGR